MYLLKLVKNNFLKLFTNFSKYAIFQIEIVYNFKMANLFYC
jgi:hypothetical protein